MFIAWIINFQKRHNVHYWHTAQNNASESVQNVFWTTDLRYLVQIIQINCYTGRLMGQHCFAGWRLSSSVAVVCNATGMQDGRRVGTRRGNAAGRWARGLSARRRPGAWAVGWPTLHGGPVRLCHVKVTLYSTSGQKILTRGRIAGGTNFSQGKS